MTKLTLQEFGKRYREEIAKLDGAEVTDEEIVKIFLGHVIVNEWQAEVNRPIERGRSNGKRVPK